MWGAPPTPHAPRGAALAPLKSGRPASVGPPHPHPLPQGARGPDRPRGRRSRLPVRAGVWGRRPAQGRRACARAVSRLPVRAGAWGRRPAQGRRACPRAVSRLPVRTGGVGAKARTGETRLPSGCVAAAGPNGGGWGRRPAQGRRACPRAVSRLPVRAGAWGRRPAQGRRACPRAVSRLPVRAGAWGRSPHRKKIRGRVGGPEPPCGVSPRQQEHPAHARPGWGCGGRSPPQETRACPRRYGRGGRPSRCPRHCSSSPAARPALSGLAKTPTPRS